MLRAVGMGDGDFAKPQIGVASSWNEITPCNLSLDRLAKAGKAGVHAGGGFPMEFGTITVSDGIFMGHVGMHYSLVSREVIADSVRLPALSSDWRQRLERVLAAGTDYFLLHLDADSRHGQLWQKLAPYVPEGPLYKDTDPTIDPLHRVVILSRAQVVEALKRLDERRRP